MTQTYILEPLKHLKKCIHSGAPAKRSGTGKRQHVSKTSSALHPASSVASLSSWAISDVHLGWQMDWLLSPSQVRTREWQLNPCQHTAVPKVYAPGSVNDLNLAGFTKNNLTLTYW